MWKGWEKTNCEYKCTFGQQKGREPGLHAHGNTRDWLGHAVSSIQGKTGEEQWCMAGKGLPVHSLGLGRENVEGIMRGQCYQVTSWMCGLRCSEVGREARRLCTGCFSRSPCVWLVTSGTEQENRWVTRKDCLGRDAQKSIRRLGVPWSITWHCFVTWVGYYQQCKWLLGFGQQPRRCLAWKCHQPWVTNFVCFQVPWYVHK